ncbi:MAG: cytochrome C assembly protein [Nitrososphaeria archaeon]|nr:cytochrome C assembly protein [Nitrososphaeria archaeon]NIQ33291.1 cytochrome C assembly protein [Nitrososphaeria archaeon]
MNRQDQVFVIAAVFVNVVAIYDSYVLAPTEVHMGEVYRIFYIHVPSAWVCYLSLGISVASSILYLARRGVKYDRVAEIAAVLGLIYGAVALLTGSMWSNAAWGAYWSWDPRQTATLILWIAYLGYVSLRLSISNVERRGVVGAVYNILAFATVPLSYFSIQLWVSLHPIIVTTTELSITGGMVEALILSTLAATLVYLYLLRLFYRVRVYEDRVNVLSLKEG